MSPENIRRVDREISYSSCIVVILIIILGFIVYANSLNGKFVWDDEDLVRNNVHIRSLSHIQEVFTEDVEVGKGKRSSLYHPLQIFTYLIDYSLWKSNVIGYHLTNTKAIAISPEYAIAHNNLSVVYCYENMYDLAIRHYDEALELGMEANPEFLALFEPYRK